MPPSEGEAFYQKVAAPCRWVIGMDEVGRGCWAGPIYMAAVMAPPSFNFPGLEDSKKTTRKWREREHDRLVAAVGPGRAFLACHSSVYIDKHGIQPAQLDLIEQLIDRAAVALAPQYERSLFVIDGSFGPKALKVPNASLLVIPKADTFVPACMAAANIAKVWRDRYMCSIERDDPAPFEPPYKYFGFASNCGYGTDQHRRAIEQHGITNEHRVSYRPIGLAAEEMRRRRSCG